MKKYFLIIAGLFLVGCGDTYWGYNMSDDSVKFNGVDLAKGECTKLKDGLSSDYPFKAGPENKEFGEDAPGHYAWDGEKAVKVTEAEAKAVCEKEDAPEAGTGEAGTGEAGGAAATGAAATGAAATGAAATGAAATGAAAQSTCKYTKVAQEDISCKNASNAETLNLRMLVYDTTATDACEVGAVLQQYVPEFKEACSGTEADCKAKKDELVKKQQDAGDTCSGTQS